MYSGQNKIVYILACITRMH